MAATWHAVNRNLLERSSQFLCHSVVSACPILVIPRGAHHHELMDTQQLKGLIEARRRLPPPSERRELRVEAGLALADIAGAIGCTRQAVANWESGRAHPRGDNLRRYVDVLAFLRRELGASP